MKFLTFTNAISLGCLGFLTTAAFANNNCPTINDTYVCGATSLEKAHELIIKTVHAPGVTTYELKRSIDEKPRFWRIDGLARELDGLEYTHFYSCSINSIHVDEFINRLGEPRFKFAYIISDPFLHSSIVEYDKVTREPIWSSKHKCVKKSHATPENLQAVHNGTKEDRSHLCKDLSSRMDESLNDLRKLLLKKRRDPESQASHQDSIGLQLGVIGALQPICEKQCEGLEGLSKCVNTLPQAQILVENYNSQPQSSFVNRTCGPCTYGSNLYYYYEEYEEFLNGEMDVSTYKSHDFKSTLSTTSQQMIVQEIDRLKYKCQEHQSKNPSCQN